jgi:Catechol dioxygenase N terminus
MRDSIIVLSTTNVYYPATCHHESMTTNRATLKVKCDLGFTGRVINSIGKDTNPRLKEMVSAFIRHSHSFMREVNLTTEDTRLWVLIDYQT